jgi:L-alanine-DL-glutamate epimerase-like enolase superfamily enzyme
VRIANYEAEIIGPLWFKKDIVKESVKIGRGYAEISREPGTGVELSEDIIKT